MKAGHLVIRPARDFLRKCRSGSLIDGQSVLILGDQAISSANNFLTSVIIGRVCSQDELGLYLLGFSIILFAATAQSALILSPFSVISPRLDHREGLLYSGSSLIGQLVFSLLAGAALIVAGLLYPAQGGISRLGPVLIALGLVLLFVQLREYCRQVSFARLDVRGAFFFDLMTLGLQSGGLLLLAFSGSLNAAHAYYAIGLACGLPSLLWLLFNIRSFSFQFARARLDFGRTWSMSKWLLGTSILYAGSNQLYPWILAALRGPEATGVLAAGLGTIYIANPFLNGMSNLMSPRAAHAMARGGVSEVRKVIFWGIRIFLVVIGFFCLVMLFFGGPAIRLLYGPHYAGFGNVVRVLALSQLASSLAFPINAGLLAMEKPDVGFKSHLLSLAVMILLGFWLVKSFGPLGAAWGLLLGNAAATAFRWATLKRILSKAEA
jgi:O-antigen/teichoic acid export membrane protein